ncbi:MAG: hypothetical protein KGH74_02315, partial [Candidatus Micrarchaeota archaeon]|nr:hypothetical protein [Candidatus Micrarchaeota archaeon]
MEYLMTYGWAILVIAIVMMSLYSLGIFSSTQYALASKTISGACQVYRPGGPGTASGIALAGQCTNLLPKYVFHTTGAQTSRTITSSSPAMSQATVIFWLMKPTNYKTGNYDGGAVTDACGPYWYILSSATTFSTAWVQQCNSPPTYSPLAEIDGLPTNQWTMLAYVIYSNGTVVSYAFVPYKIYTASGNNGAVAVPAGQWWVYPGWFTNAPTATGSSVANLQIYNTSLDNVTVKALYHEGIGGAPIDLQHLVGWWPL